MRAVGHGGRGVVGEHGHHQLRVLVPGREQPRPDHGAVAARRAALAPLRPLRRLAVGVFHFVRVVEKLVFFLGSGVAVVGLLAEAGVGLLEAGRVALHLALLLVVRVLVLPAPHLRARAAPVAALRPLGPFRHLALPLLGLRLATAICPCARLPGRELLLAATGVGLLKVNVGSLPQHVPASAGHRTRTPVRPLSGHALFLKIVKHFSGVSCRVLGAAFLVQSLPREVKTSKWLHWRSRFIKEGRRLIVRKAGCDASNDVLGDCWHIRRSVCDAAVRADVPRVEVELQVLHPGAVLQAQLQAGDAHDPVRRRIYHRDN